MSREAAFNFIPVSQLGINTHKGLLVHLDKKNRFLTFSSKCIEAKDLIGHYLKFFVDKQKNVLGWRILEVEKGFEPLGDYFPIKEVSSTKYTQIKVYVPKVVIDSLKFKDGTKYSNLGVKTYQPGGLLKEQEYYYININ